MTVLSVQSQVAYGFVGNSAAAFCLRRIGVDVWPVDTVAFSNHPGYGRFAGRVHPARSVADIVDGLFDLGVLAGCRAVLTGYMGGVDTGRVVLDALARLRAVVPPVIYCCDPVMGDRDAGLYVPAPLVTFFRHEAIAFAHILMPNHFEAEILAERPLPTLAAVVAGARALLARGPRVIVISSVVAEDLPANKIATLAVTADGAWCCVTPCLPLQAKGSGDVLAALFLARHLAGAHAADGLSLAVSSLFAVIEATSRAGSSELHLIQEQDALVEPRWRFPAEPLVGA